MAAAVEMLNISKFYPGVVATDYVSFSIDEGQILGLIGENGAGKSTMMNMLYGMTEPDIGTIKLFGKEVRIQSPNMAIKMGIGNGASAFYANAQSQCAPEYYLGECSYEKWAHRCENGERQDHYYYETV